MNSEHKRHPAAIAWDRFREQNQTTFEPYDFTQPGYSQYLENRLHRAFTAGFDAASTSLLNEKQPDKGARDAVMRLAESGLTNVAIARQLGVTRERVRQIKNTHKEQPDENE